MMRIGPSPVHSATGRRAIWLGALSLRHSAYAELRALARELARVTGATLGELAEGANAAGAYLAGCVPHRDPAGQEREKPGLNARDMLEKPLRGYLLLGTEPWADSTQPEALLDAGEFAVRGGGYGLRFAGHAGSRAGAVAGRRLCRDLGHLRQPRGPVAEFRRGRARAGRGATGAGRSCGCWAICSICPILTIRPRSKCATNCGRRWSRRLHAATAADFLRRAPAGPKTCATCPCIRWTRCCGARARCS